MAKTTMKHCGRVNGYDIWHDTSVGAMHGGGEWAAIPHWDDTASAAYAATHDALMALIDPLDTRKNPKQE